MKEPNYKLGFLDIENSPNVSYTWGKYQQDVIAFEQEWYIMAASWKWAHEAKPKGFYLPDYSLYKKEPENDYELVKTLWELFDKADLIIGHNHCDFDIRKVNARFVYHGFPPPSPYKTVDTLKIARRHFMFNSNKLGDLAEYLGVQDGKLETGGFKLWLECMNGDMAAWNRMKKYNVRDVVVLEQVYEALRGWHEHHPNINLAEEGDFKCPVCGGKTERKGWRFLKSFKARQYHCLNKTCGKYSQGKREKIQAQVLS